MIAGLVIIFFLGRSALDGIRDLADRAAMRRAQEQQAAAYPTIATGIAQQNATLRGDVVSVASGTPSDAAPTDDVAQPASTTTTISPVTAEIDTATAISTETTVPTDAPASTNSPEPSATDLPSQTPTSEADVPLVASVEPSSTTAPSETPTATTTDTAVPPTSTDTAIPPSETNTATNTALPPTSTDTDTPVPPTTTFTETATDTATLTETATFSPTVAPSNTPGRVLIPTNTRRPALATNTPAATATPLIVGQAATETPTDPPPTVAVTPVPPQPTATATNSELVAAPTSEPTVGELIAAPTLQATSTLPRVLGRDSCTDKPQPTAVPTAAPRLKSNGNDILNILLLGSDQDVDPGDPSYRTDVILIVSINRTTNTVSMLSLPRDLYLCIPQLGMNRINVAYEWGEAVGWAPGGGFGLMQETILYNTGIPIHYYARISLNGFKQVVDSVGGVDIAVECPVRDSLRWLGKYDENGDPLYEPFSLEPGYYHMDGSFALWYARTRKASTGGTDFDRNRRQQQVLRAIWHTARDQGLIQKAPELWNQLTSLVDTNLNLVDALGLAPIALGLEPADITTYYMFKGYELDHFRTPNNEDVQIPVPEAFFTTINNFYTPPSANRLGQENAKIEIYNGSGNENWDKMAAEVLGYKGLVASPMGAVDAAPTTVIYDFTGGASPASLNVILKAYGLKSAAVVNQPDPNRTVDFKITLGTDFNGCTAPGYQR